MTKEKLDKHLNELHEEIKNTDPEKSESQEVLDSLLDNIQTVLEHPGDASFKHHRILLENLSDSITHFEVEHPTLTTLINNVIMTLNSMGI